MSFLNAMLIAQYEARGGLRILGLLLIIGLVLAIILLFRRVRKG
jgi:hypothetical protein